MNWLGDSSAKGVRQSAGIVVNYLYQLDQLERNHEALVNRKHLFVARAVAQLAKGAPLLMPFPRLRRSDPVVARTRAGSSNMVRP